MLTAEQSRFFIIEDESLFPALKEFDAKHIDIVRKRKKFFEDWGSDHYIETNPGRFIDGLKDPRTFDPPKPLPKGWCKIYRSPGFVKPTNSKIGNENQMQLQSMNYPIETKVVAEIVNRIMRLDDFNRHRIGGYHEFDGDKVVKYFATIDDEQYYLGFPIASFYHLRQWCIIVSDPGLQITNIPGCRQIKKWEYDKTIDELSEWVVNTDFFGLEN